MVFSTPHEVGARVGARKKGKQVSGRRWSVVWGCRSVPTLRVGELLTFKVAANQRLIWMGEEL